MTVSLGTKTAWQYLENEKPQQNASVPIHTPPIQYFFLWPFASGTEEFNGISHQLCLIMSIDPSEYLADPGYFNVSPQGKAPMLIAIAGGASSGKLEVCRLIEHKFASKADTNVSVLSLHSFYRELSEHEQQLAVNGDLNFDHPSAFDFDLLESVLKDLLVGKSVEVPVWDNRLHKRVGVQEIHTAHVILLEGILVLYPASIRRLLNMKVYIDIDSDDRLASRVQNNSILTDPVPLERVLRQYVKFVKRSHDEFVQPTKQYADIIVPRGMKNKAALTLITEHIASFLQRKDAYVVSDESGRTLLGSDRSRELLGSKDSEFKLIPQ
ncbi:uridine kinase family-domain-containing protein [Umbelopsis sp. PMI_123]|nr:uridine kinase family-domain-containing protein [Umbelopsis sp. PMI_123]